MEEDIKILEEFIEHIKFVEERTLYELEAKERCKKRYKAIENLLKTYKQFKELKENSIPKQVIRDKIEEIEKTPCNTIREIHIDTCIISTLKELLEEE